MSEAITVHPLTQNPTKAWEEISKTQRVIKIAYKPPKTENNDLNKARIVVMSDTHSLTRHLKFDIPDGDIFIHAGDFTACGGEEEVKEFNEFLGQLPHEHKLVIAGNHELSFDPSFTHPLTRNRGHHQGLFDEIPLLGHKKEKLEESVKSENIRQHLTNCTYLEDSSAEIYGIKFYGTPWNPVVIDEYEGIRIHLIYFEYIPVLSMGIQPKSRRRNTQKMESYTRRHGYSNHAHATSRF